MPAELVVPRHPRRALRREGEVNSRGARTCCRRLASSSRKMSKARTSGRRRKHAERVDQRLALVSSEDRLRTNPSPLQHLLYLGHGERFRWQRPAERVAIGRETIAVHINVNRIVISAWVHLRLVARAV